MWKQQLIETTRGIFEIFTKGEGKPLCVTHLYSELTRMETVLRKLSCHMYTKSERESYFQNAVTKIQAIQNVEGIIQLQNYLKVQ